MSKIYSYYDISKSGYYKSIKRQAKEDIHEQLILELVMEKRSILPEYGSRKLYHDLYNEIQQIRKMGRDAFMDLLRRNNMLITKKKKYCTTTYSRHSFGIYKNLLKDKELTRPNEAYAVDITYLRIYEGFVYLALVTDMYSRKIVGWDLSRSLSMEGAYRAMQAALKQRRGRLPLIHHSDRGIQYCCNDYVKLLKSNNIDISMTEENHCYENGMAERVNGILKGEFHLDATFRNLKDCQRAVKQSIIVYNDFRSHYSLGLKTPSLVHSQRA